MVESDSGIEHWVESAEALAPLEDGIAAAHELALDTESNSMFAYRERVCLVQLRPVGDPEGGHRAGPLVVLDPLAIGERAFDPLRAFFQTGRRVLMHGGEYDVAVLKRELGVGPARVFDSQAAASLLGFERTGYVNLVHELLGVELAKEHQQFDWGKRPIPASARRYAFDDVRHLPELVRVLESMADDRDLVDEVEVACEAVANAQPHTGLSEGERFWRVAGKAKVAGEALTRLHALFLWRESEAMSRDVPPARLVPNDVLVALAERPPTEARHLEGRGISRRLVTERADAILEAARSPSTAVPPRPRGERPDPAKKKLEARLKQWREAEARRRQVTIQAVLPTRALDALASGVDWAEVPQLGKRRLELYRQTLEALLRG